MTMRMTLVGQRGYTFIELLIVTTILLILASAVMPLAQVTSQRQREAELRRSLREMRTAIDAFKNAVDLGLIPTTELEPGNEGYPPTLDILVEGISAANDVSGRQLRFLRRIPVDPTTGDSDWGLRSYQDSPDSTTWGRQNVYDVYTRTGGTGLDGTDYSDW
ncbi:MAG: type II secretion system protein [Acidobacteria bacterium]|nr:type II secretion system protein [Acidobacteriota bacterium]